MEGQPVRQAAFCELDSTESTFGTPSTSSARNLQHRRSSSNGAKTVATRPTTVHIQVAATGSGRWTDETGSVADSVDCAVQVAVGQQEVKQQPAVARRSRRWWIRRAVISTVVLGCMLTAVLVPYSLVVGFNTKLPVEYKLLPPPAPVHRIIFAFSGKITHQTADSILPETLAGQVLQWTVVASSGVHVAAFSSRQAMQRALAVLAAAAELRYAVADFRLLPDRRVSSISSPEELNDLSRLPARQLLQQQGLQETQQQQQQQEHRSLQQNQRHLSNRSATRLHALHSGDGSSYKAVQVSKLVATHMQRLAERKAKRRQLLLHHQPSLASIRLPETAQNLNRWSGVAQDEQEDVAAATHHHQQQRQHFETSQGPVGAQRLPQQHRQAHREVATTHMQNTHAAAAASTPDSTICDEGSLPGHPTRRQQQRLEQQQQRRRHGHCLTKSCAPDIVSWADVIVGNSSTSSTPSSKGHTYLAAAAAGSMESAPFSGTAAAAAAADGQLLSFQHQRRLHQYQPPPPPPTPQPQQKQAQMHPQKGGKGVAWYLTDAGLRLKEAWNVTYGVDDVLVAVLDSGVELSQGGIGPSVWVNAGEVVGDSIDNDGNGYVDDVMGWDFGGTCADAACSACSPGSDPTDSSGWGTHAAGVIAGQPEVAARTAGIAPGVRVMALKVSDCRASGVLGDAVARQLQFGGGVVDAGAAAADGPMLLASAAVQAIDYALLNGAHIVLAAWQAGGVIDSSSSSSGGNASEPSPASVVVGAPTPSSEVENIISGGQQRQELQRDELNCVLGEAATAAAGSAAATGDSGCLEAAQKLLFMDALKPLEEAGVLVVTMHPGAPTSSSSSTTDISSSTGSPDPTPSATAGAVAAVLPCSLGLELSNVLCVAPSRPVAASAEAISSSASGTEYFADLIYTLNAYSQQTASNTTGGNTTSSNSSTASKEAALPEFLSNGAAGTPPKADQAVNAATDVPSVARTLLLEQHAVQLQAPGTNILSGWAWGSHAVVSGGSVAAAVAAGAAALTWSNLGQTLGADAAGAGAHEGLGQLVKGMLVDSSSSSSSRSRDSGDGGGSMGFTMEQASVGVRGGVAGVAGELNLLQAIKKSSEYAGPLQLRPAHISPTITAISSTLSYSWYISSSTSGPFDTPAMSFVARKALDPAAPFPLHDWEFFGYTALVEVEGFVLVQSPGNYSLAVLSEDKFIVWLQDKWLSMAMVGEAGAAVGLDARAWTAGVQFSAPGYYKLRVIIYMPSLSPFDLLWQPPGATAFAHIPHFASFSRTQPLPMQLADNMAGHMLTHGSSSGSSRAGSAGMLSSKISSELSGSSSDGSGSTSSNGAQVGSAVVNGPNDASSSSSGVVGTAGGTAAGNTATAGSSPPADGGVPPVPSSSGNGSNVAAVGSAATDDDGGSSSTPGADSSSSSYYPAPERPLASSDMQMSGGAQDPSLGAVAAVPLSQDQQPGMYRSSRDGIVGAPAGDGWGSGLGNIFNMIWSGFGSMFERGQGSAQQLLPDAPNNSLYDDEDSSSGSDGGTDERSGSSSRLLLGNDSSDGASYQHQQQHHQQHNQPSPQWWQLHQFDGSSARSLLAALWMNGPGMQTVAPLPGVFSFAMTLEDPWSYRTIIPSLRDLNLRRTGILPGPGLEISSGLVLQQQLLGYIDESDGRAGYGVVQGWLDWKTLNPDALEWLQGMDSGQGAGGGSSSINSSSSSGGSSEWVVMDGVQAGRAGVQFEVACGSTAAQQGCSLHLDGLTVAGSLGEAAQSACIVPARRLAGSSSSKGAAAAAADFSLMHLELLFATDALLATVISVKFRPCLMGSSGAAELPSGADGTFAVVTAAAGASALGLSSAAVEATGDAAVPGGYTRGMLCTVRAAVPPAAAAAGSSSSSSSGLLEKVVFVSVQQMQQAMTSSYDASEALASSSNSSSSDSSAATNSSSSIDTTTPSNSSAGSNTSSTDSNSTSSASNSTDNNSTEDGAFSGNGGYPAPQLDTHAEVTTRVVAGIKGIAVSQLAPDWVSSLPADTTYGFTCGCYWNGSWEGGVTAGVHAGSSGRADLYLAGWRVDAERVLPQYGPSDVVVSDYSSWQQRMQLESSSSSADPIRWRTGADGAGGSGVGLAGLGVLGDPAAAAELGFRPGQLVGGEVFMLGEFNGWHPYSVPAGAGWHQLLVVQGEGLAAWGSVVIVTDVPNLDDISSSNSSQPYAPTKQGWLPGAWDAWVPQ